MFDAYTKKPKMAVPSQKYDSSCPFVFDAFCYLKLPCDYGLSKLIFILVQYFVILLFTHKGISEFEDRQFI